MATDYTYAVQKAVHQALSQALTSEVYDGAAPSDAVMPYVTFADLSERPDDPVDSRRSELLMTLTVWSAYRGRKEASGLIADIDAALHRQRLPMDAGRMVRAFVTRKRTVPDIDGETYQGTVTVRLTYEH